MSASKAELLRFAQHFYAVADRHIQKSRPLSSLNLDAIVYQFQQLKPPKGTRGKKTCLSKWGHKIPMDVVAQWVLKNHGVDLASLDGEQSQKLVNDFVEANGEEYPTYLVGDGWGHIFMGDSALTTRWVYQLNGNNPRLRAGEIFLKNRWQIMSLSELKDVQESLHANEVPDNYETEWSGDTKVVTKLPLWARVHATMPHLVH